MLPTPSISSGSRLAASWQEYTCSPLRWHLVGSARTQCCVPSAPGPAQTSLQECDQWNFKTSQQAGPALAVFTTAAKVRGGASASVRKQSWWGDTHPGAKLGLRGQHSPAESEACCLSRLRCWRAAPPRDRWLQAHLGLLGQVLDVLQFAGPSLSCLRAHVVFSLCGGLCPGFPV